jgi:hypothetical protein
MGGVGAPASQVRRASSFDILPESSSANGAQSWARVDSILGATLGAAREEKMARDTRLATPDATPKFFERSTVNRRAAGSNLARVAKPIWSQLQRL